MYRKRNYWLAAGLIGLNGSAFGLGLGQIEVHSGLNEPLDAEIRVLSASSSEVKGLKAQLASPEAFERVGIDRTQLGQPLTFSVETNTDGESVIRVRTKDIVRDPYLSFLLEVNFSSGKLLREYTVLLDPPVFTAARQTAVLVAKEVRETKPAREEVREPVIELAQESPVDEAEPAAVMNEPPPPAEPTPMQEEPVAQAEPALVVEPVENAQATAAEPEPQPEPQAAIAEATPESIEAAEVAEAAAAAAEMPEPVATAPEAQSANQYGPVAAGTTLYQVARELRPSNTEKMIVALYRTNPEAFFDQNVNALKRGAVLRVPSQAEMDAISVVDAQSALRSDNARWNEYRQSKAANVPKLAELSAPTEVPAEAPSTPQSRLELVPPKSGDEGSADRPGNTSAAAAADAAKVAAELNRTREELTAATQESAEFRSRVSELEKINVQREQVIALQNQQLKDLEDQLKKSREAAALAAKVQAAEIKADPVEPVPEVKPVPTEAGLAEAPAPTTTPGVTAEDVWGTPTATTDPAQPVDPDATATVVDPTIAEVDPSVAPVDGEPVTDPTASTDPTATIPTDTTVVETPPAEVVPVEPTPVPVAVAPAGSSLTETLTSTPVLAGLAALVAGLGGLAFWRSRRRKPTDESQLRNIPASADDLFPPMSANLIDGSIGELDMLDMVRAQPDDLDTRLELIRYYAEQGESDKFEQQAREFHQHLVDPNDERWQEISEMGRQILPNNALFDTDSDLPFADGPQTDPFLDFDPPSMGEQASLKTEAQPVSGLPDFSFGRPVVDEAATQFITPVAADVSAKDDFSFDFSGLDTPTQVKANDDFSFDFDLPSTQPVAPSFEPTTQAMKPISNDFEVDFSFDMPPKVEAQPIAASLVADSSFDFTPSPKDDFSFDTTPAKVEGDDELFDTDDTVGTKLDLARAYIDMGDPDGARGMLEEVINEGSDQQRGEATRLLATF